MNSLTEAFDLMLVTETGDKQCGVARPECRKQAVFLVFLTRLCSCSDRTEIVMCMGHKEETAMYGGTCTYCGALIVFKGARPVC
jgi:hypothetical protein